MFYSQAPWPQRTKLGTNVAKGISSDIVVLFFSPVNPPWVIALRRGGTQLRGGSPEKKKKTTISQLMPLATFVPSLGRCGQGAWL